MGRFRSLWRLATRPPISDAILLSVMAAFGIYIISGIFSPGLLYQWDLSQHFVESYYAATVLLPTYHQFIGWNPYYYLGYPQGQFDPPMGYAIYAVMFYALSWATSPLMVYKIMIALFFVTPAFSLYFAASLFRFSRLSGFFAGLFALGTAGGFEQGGPIGVMQYGLYEYATAVALIPFILAVYHLAFERKSWLLLLTSAILVAFDFLLHTIAGVFLVLVLVVYTIAFIGKQTIFHRERLAFIRGSGKFLAVAVLALGICAFWIIPAAANQSFYAGQNSLVTELGSYGTTYNDIVDGLVFGQTTIPYSMSLIPNLHPTVYVELYKTNQAIISFSSIMYYQVLMALAAGGLILGLVRRKLRLPAFVAIGVIVVFLFISLGPKYYEFLWHMKTFQLLDLRPARAAAPARIFLLLLAGAAIGESVSLVSASLSKWRLRAVRVARAAGIVLLLVFALSLVSNAMSLTSQLNLGSTTANVSSASNLSQVFSWIQQNAPNTTRVAYEEYPSADQHLMSVSPYYTGKQAIGSEYGFWWLGADASTTTTEILSSVGYYTDYAIVNTLEGLNAGYVVAWNSATKLNLEQDGQFTLVKQIGIFDILKINSFTPSYAEIQNGSGTAVVTSLTPENIVVHLSNVTAGSSLLVRVEYYTDWTASTSFGQQLTVIPDTVELPLTSVEYMSVPVTRSGSFDITLHYGSQKSQTLGDSLSIVSLVLSGLAAALAYRTRFDTEVLGGFPVRVRSALDFVRHSARRSDAPASPPKNDETGGRK